MRLPFNANVATAATAALATTITTIYPTIFFALIFLHGHVTGRITVASENKELQQQQRMDDSTKNIAIAGTGSTANNALSSFEKELLIAQLAVQRATILTKRVFQDKDKGTISKTDTSPVTIGDFGAQALIIHAIKSNFPDDPVMGEEDTSSLRENHQLSNMIWNQVKIASLSDADAEAALGGPIKSPQDMLDAIDQGNSTGGATGRFWVLDPIDGTKGFLRGAQYASCLALIVDGEVKVGVLGCPNLSSAETPSVEGNSSEKGVLLSAVAGGGAMSRKLGHGKLEARKPIRTRPIEDVSKAILCEGVESGHSSHENQAKVAAELGISAPSIRMDSQTKYAAVAMGMGDIYLRLSLNTGYEEKIWDHAAGDIIVREAGGKVTDTLGQRLDFSRGRTLVGVKGVIVASQDVHSKTLETVKKVYAPN